MLYSLRKIWGDFWWKYVPGEKVRVRWPTPDPADPNFHYRGWLERHVGRQRIDWDWNLEDYDMSENKMTIKFRLGKTDSAVIVKMMWG